jgi:hypothetical protein
VATAELLAELLREVLLREALRSEETVMPDRAGVDVTNVTWICGDGDQWARCDWNRWSAIEKQLQH